MKFIYIYILVGFSLLGCKTQTKNSSVYIGGEIINPHSNFVLIMKNETVIDSLHLNSDNTFGKRILGLPSGLYSFKHGYEFQYIYLDPYDSIKLRLNTWDFDETIVFEGKGSSKNELLINLFLENEKELKNFYSYFSLEEKEFEEKINTAFKRQKEQLNSLLNTETDLSKEYIYIANAAINYPLYQIKELYPYYHKKLLQNDSIPTISESFYAYRKKINLNDELLVDFFAYQRFVSTYLFNMAYQKNNGKTNNQKFYILLFKLILENIKTESVKNNLLQREIDHLFINKPEFVNSEILDIFYNNNTDSIVVSNFKQAVLSKKNLAINSVFPNFEVVSSQGKNQNIRSITTNKNVVLYFWSSHIISNEYLYKRISYLTTKHPNIAFIGINTDKPVTQNSSYLSNLKNQYFLTATSQGKKLISKQYPRAILINSKGKISNSFTVLTSSCIDDQINKLSQL